VKSDLFKTICVAGAIISALILTGYASAMPSNPHHGLLKEPWELMVQMGHEGEGLHFPVKISDPNKSGKLDETLPVMGTPLIIRLEQYLPDLKWETAVSEKSGGGTVAKVILRGENLRQEMWLSSGDPAKQSISSSIGSVRIKEFHDANVIAELSQAIGDSNVVGILSAWPDNNKPVEFAAYTSKIVNMPNSSYKVSIVEYLPHYSFDSETKKVTSRSDKPVNPAIRVRLDGGQSSSEAWLWSKYGAYSHTQSQLPFRMEFISFDLSGPEGEYVLLTSSAAESKPWLLFFENGKMQLKEAKLEQSFNFMDKNYSFSFEKIAANSVVETKWKNNSESLLHPALIATIENGDVNDKAVIEFDKPFHCKTKFGTMVLFYRSSPAE